MAERLRPWAQWALDLSLIGLGTGALWAQGLSPLGPVALAPCGPGNG